MKTKQVFRFVLVALWAGMLATPTFSQNRSEMSAPVTYSEVMYHKLLPGHTLAEAVAIEKEWKTVHQVQLEQKTLTGWYVLTKSLTSNPNPEEYDYITIKNFTDMGMQSNPYPNKDLEKAYGSEYKTKWADLLKRTGATQIGNKVELWRSLDGVLSNKPISPIWVIEFMKVKDNLYSEYVALEQTFKPLHQERVAMDNINGWTFASLLYPNATEKGYEYATVNYYPDMKNMTDGRYMEAFNKVMPGQDTQKLVDAAYKTRDIVRQEVYILREYVAPAPTQAMK